jgi:endonuclease/exonuclease/phosphatase family metal-dependent hydrolase
MVLVVFLFLFFPPSDTTLVESGKAATLRKQTSTPQEIKIVSYNIRWRSGDHLKKIIELLENDPEIGGAAILGLQEVDRRKQRSGNTNTVKMLADELGLHYAWAAPPSSKPNDEEETGVAILSVYPLSDIRRIVLPHAGPNGRRRVAGEYIRHMPRRAFHSIKSWSSSKQCWMISRNFRQTCLP